jgi:hypothetical protein
MDKPRRRPDIERIVRIICVIVNEAVKVIQALRGH